MDRYPDRCLDTVTEARRRKTGLVCTSTNKPPHHLPLQNLPKMENGGDGADTDVKVNKLKLTGVCRTPRRIPRISFE